MALRSATVSLSINAIAYLDSAGELGSAQTSVRPETTYAAGTSDSQADTSFTSTYEVTTTPTTIDLRAGTITQPDGTVATFAEITTLYIANAETSGGYVTVGGGSNPVLNIAGVVRPGGMLLFHDPVGGYPVTAATADILTLTASAGTITTKVVVLGRSA